MFNTQSWTLPSSTPPSFKLGFKYSNDSLREETLINLRNYLIENNLTYQPRKDLVVGWNLHLDPRVSNLEKYDFGLTWGCCGSVNVGFRHESTSKEFLQLGKFFLLFNHSISARQTVGSEFTLDWQRRSLEARLGVSHQFNDETTGKFKLNHHGYLDVVLKHKLSNLATLGIASGFNLKAAVAE